MSKAQMLNIQDTFNKFITTMNTEYGTDLYIDDVVMDEETDICRLVVFSWIADRKDCDRIADFTYTLTDKRYVERMVEDLRWLQSRVDYLYDITQEYE